MTTPLSEIQIRDPFVVTDAAAEEYLLFGTSGFGEIAHGGFSVRRSRDLLTWTDPVAVLAPGEGPVGATAFWAPEVVEYRGRWYLLGSFMHGTEITRPDQRYTRIYVSDSARGPFRPLTHGPITPVGWWSIDGTLHVESDGTPWLIFVREWLQTHDGEMHAMPLTSDLRSAAGPPRLLFRASEASWSKPQTWGRFAGYHVTDGAWLHRTKAGELSSFGATGYATGIARSDSGAVTGPWLQSPEPLYSADGGHGMLFTTLAGQLTLALHTPNRPPDERAKFLAVKEVRGGLAFE
jgi:arabinan endo-1,5-alpha-L-arabinosidase